MGRQHREEGVSRLPPAPARETARTLRVGKGLTTLIAIVNTDLICAV